MKRFIILIFSIILLFVFGAPLVVLYGTNKVFSEKQPIEQTVKVLDKRTGEIRNRPIEEYLVGVVAAEMPAAFEVEALKAQAVAARTYTIKRMFNFGAKPNPQHPEAEICTDPTHCQAWIDEAEQKKKWGSIKYYVNIERIRSAVRQTKGLVITYNNALIDPVYHGSCGGKGTENSEDVWSGQIPYLRSVDCPFEYKADQQTVNVQTNKNKLAGVLGGGTAIPVLSQSSDKYIIPLKKSSRGRIQEVVVSGKKMSGTELRKMLGLGSTYMKWDVKGDKVYFTSTGKGHAVGMCQYGANGMVLAGKSYKDILFHYYAGVRITKLKY